MGKHDSEVKSKSGSSKDKKESDPEKKKAKGSASDEHDDALPEVVTLIPWVRCMCGRSLGNIYEKYIQEIRKVREDIWKVEYEKTLEEETFQIFYRLVKNKEKEIKEGTIVRVEEEASKEKDQKSLSDNLEDDEKSKGRPKLTKEERAEARLKAKEEKEKVLLKAKEEYEQAKIRAKEELEREIAELRIVRKRVSALPRYEINYTELKPESVREKLLILLNEEAEERARESTELLLSTKAQTIVNKKFRITLQCCKQTLATPFQLPSGGSKERTHFIQPGNDAFVEQSIEIRSYSAR